MNTKQFYSNMDRLVEDWYNSKYTNPYLTAPSTCLLNTPYIDTMPEPFFGELEDNLMTIMDLNPSYTPGDEQVLSKSNYHTYIQRNLYGAYARPFPALKKSTSFPIFHSAGAGWWRKRLIGLLEFPELNTGNSIGLSVNLSAKPLNLDNDFFSATNTAPNPFAIERCPYHSNSGKGVSTRTSVKQWFKENVLPALLYGASHSRLGYALVFPQTNANFLETLLGKPSCVWAEDAQHGLVGWPLKSSNVYVKKTFTYFKVNPQNVLPLDSIICNDCTPARILVVEANNMRLPSPEFFASTPSQKSIVEQIVEYMRLH